MNADPWRLFPAWMRDQLPVPPGIATPKARRLDFLAALQTRPPLWVGVRGQDEKTIWAALRDAGLKPWIHRRVPTAAKLPPETDLLPFEAFRTGRLVPQDLASQAVAIVCDPDPGERWWDVNGESGLHALHLAALMGGKGVVVCTFEQERRRRENAARLRRGAFHNITTRLWDGRHAAGKAGSYNGVLVDAVCSGIGSWRRHPDARWTMTAARIPELVERQLQCLDAASNGVRAGRNPGLHRLDRHSQRDRRGRGRVPRARILSSNCSRFLIPWRTRRRRAPSRSGRKYRTATAGSSRG